ncbi:hypothetical protein [Lactobacillus equicursoris]|nr:hypothetical protein [Lactobacillus equicursoris]
MLKKLKRANIRPQSHFQSKTKAAAPSTTALVFAVCLMCIVCKRGKKKK